MEISWRRLDYRNADEYHVIPLYDIHWGAAGCDEQALRQTISVIRDRPRYLFFLGGDNLECINIRDDRRFEPNVPAKRYTRRQLQTLPQVQTRELKRELWDIRDKCLGVMAGNHEYSVSQRGDFDPGEQLADDLGAPYLGMECYIQLLFRQPDGQGRKFEIFAKHQFSQGGITTGGDINALERATAGVEADILIGGHTHKQFAFVGSRLHLAGTEKHARLKNTPKVYVMAGSYRKTRTAGITEYTDRKRFFPPVPIGSVDITIKPADRQIWASQGVR